MTDKFTVVRSMSIYMNLKSFIWALMVAMAPVALAGEYVAYHVDGRWPLLLREQGAIISAHCQPLSEQHKCRLNQVLAGARKNSRVKFNTLGGKNPASVLCQQLLGGGVSIARDVKGHSNTFCLFDDGSMIDGNGLLLLLKEKGIYP